MKIIREESEYQTKSSDLDLTHDQKIMWDYIVHKKGVDFIENAFITKFSIAYKAEFNQFLTYLFKEVKRGFDAAERMQNNRSDEPIEVTDD